MAAALSTGQPDSWWPLFQKTTSSFTLDESQIKGFGVASSQLKVIAYLVKGDDPRLSFGPNAIAGRWRDSLLELVVPRECEELCFVSLFLASVVVIPFESDAVLRSMKWLLNYNDFMAGPAGSKARAPSASMVFLTSHTNPAEWLGNLTKLTPGQKQSIRELNDIRVAMESINKAALSELTDSHKKVPISSISALASLSLQCRYE